MELCNEKFYDEGVPTEWKQLDAQDLFSPVGRGREYILPDRAPTQRGLSAGPIPCPGVGSTDSEAGREGEVGRVVVERARGTVSACPASDQSEACLISDENGVDTVEVTHRQRTGVRNASTCLRYRVTRFSRADATLGVEWRARSRNPNVG